MPSKAIAPEFISRMPKAELHLHLEGSISLARLLELSRRQGSDLHRLATDRLEDQLFRYESLGQFLESYKVVCQHLKRAEDYVALVEDLFDYFRANRIQYAEVIYTPSIPWRFERDGAAILEAVLDRCRQLSRKSGVQVRWILDCVRQFGVEEARRTAELAVELAGKGVVAIGLGGDEKARPAAEFEPVFSWARANALYIHAHAGEVGEPSQVWDVLKRLGANRIGHGIQAARDPELMEYLREHAIALDICLTSNASTGAWRPVSDNPFWLLHKRGVPVTLNTDDPGLFRTSLIREYETAARIFHLDHHDLAYVALQGVRSAFLPHEEKMQLMQRFQDEIHRLVSDFET